MLRFLPASLCALALASCTSYEFRRQELAFRHDAATDVLELIVVEHGLCSTGSMSEAQVAADAAGARHVILFGWPFEFDLQKLEGDLREEVAKGTPFAERTLAWLPEIAVADAALWVDEGGELSLYRRFRVEHASEGLALFSAVINAECLDHEAWNDVARKWDAPTGALWEEHVRAGRSWASFADGGLVVRAPVSATGAALALAEAMRQSQDGLLPLAEALTALTLEGGLATLAFLPDETGWVRLHPAHRLPDDAKALPPPVGTDLSPPPADVLKMLAAPRRPPASDGR